MKPVDIQGRAQQNDENFDVVFVHGENRRRSVKRGWLL
jgi:hypothetical protein